MKINIICIGKIKNKDLLSVAEDYFKRVNFFVDLNLVHLKDSTPEKEAKDVLEYKEKHKDEEFYLLDENGQEFDSIEFSKEIKKNMEFSKVINFVIAGAYGFDKKTKLKFTKKLSLSQMTYPHEIAQILLLEQLYRAFSILKGKNYHK